ncbi:MAG: hypothetical protein ACOYO1_00715 [Bacteroidales bacterium]
MFLKIPFQIQHGKIECEADIIQSVNNFIELIVSSEIGSFQPDLNFGFVFKNYKFENFDETNGTLMCVEKKVNEKNDINYTKKIIDSSNNSNNFALDLKRSIEKYEQRLKNIYVSMEYERAEKLIKLKIEGKLNIEKPTNYSHSISFHVWK